MKNQKTSVEFAAKRTLKTMLSPQMFHISFVACKDNWTRWTSVPASQSNIGVCALSPLGTTFISAKCFAAGDGCVIEKP